MTVPYLLFILRVHLRLSLDHFNQNKTNHNIQNYLTSFNYIDHDFESLKNKNITFQKKLFYDFKEGRSLDAFKVFHVPPVKSQF